MNRIILKCVTIVACAMAGVGTSTLALADNTANTAPRPADSSGGHGIGHGPFGKVLTQLDLTPEQQQSVRSILQNARTQMTNEVPDFAVLANPGDPNYAAAVAQAKALASQRVQQLSDVAVQIYAILTPEQKAKLPQVVADLKAKFEQRRKEWQRQGASG